jgi:type II secretory pathway component PulC
MTGRTAAVAVAAALAAACAPAHRPAPSAPVEGELEDDELAAASAGAAQAAAPSRSERLPTDGELAGTIARNELTAVLELGPGHLLGGIEVTAVKAGPRFVGWQLDRYAPTDARVGGAPLRRGDIVAAVNDRPIERPEQLQEVFEHLRTADELVIHGERDGRAFRLRYAIE